MPYRTLQALLMALCAALKPDSENVSVVLVPRPETPWTIISAPARIARTSARSDLASPGPALHGEAAYMA